MDDTLRRYIERALELADERQDELDEQDLAEIARDLGLTDADLARVEQAIVDHVDRGKGYADHGMWDDAIRELEEAAAIAPTRVPVRLALADALTERWAATDFPDDQRRAKELARAVIDREPSNKQAYALLARLNPTSAPPPTKPKPEPEMAAPGSPQRLLVLVLALGAIAALGAGGALYMLMQPSPATTRALVEVPPPVDIEVEPYESGEVDLPVEYVEDKDLAFHARKSWLSRYPNNAFYKMWGEFEVTGDVELEEIEVGVKLMNGSGNVVKHHLEKAWASHEARLRKGDHANFTLLVEAPHDVESVVLNIVRISRHNAKGPYAESPLLTPNVTVTVPEHLKLEVRERAASFSPMMNGPKGFFEATWEFKNVGDVPIRKLTYTVDIYGPKDKRLALKKKLATFPSHPPIEPGDVFLESTIEMIDQAHQRYDLNIIEFE